jgi:hypothetical protein
MELNMAKKVQYHNVREVTASQETNNYFTWETDIGEHWGLIQTENKSILTLNNQPAGIYASVHLGSTGNFPCSFSFLLHFFLRPPDLMSHEDPVSTKFPH